MKQTRLPSRPLSYIFEETVKIRRSIRIYITHLAITFAVFVFWGHYNLAEVLEVRLMEV